MNRLLVKILLAMLMFPSTFILSVCVFALLESIVDDFLALAGGCFVAGGFAVGYWLMLWRDTVRWTAGRVDKTVGAAIVAAMVGGFIFVLLASAMQYDGEYVGLVVGGSVAVLGWFTATVLIWRETAEERADRLRQQGSGTVACVRCGYNMTGLREPRCPECGTTYTLDQLVASRQLEHQEAALTEDNRT